MWILAFVLLPNLIWPWRPVWESRFQPWQWNECNDAGCRVAQEFIVFLFDSNDSYQVTSRCPLPWRHVSGSWLAETTSRPFVTREGFFQDPLFWAGESFA